MNLLWPELLWRSSDSVAALVLLLATPQALRARRTRASTWQVSVPSLVAVLMAGVVWADTIAAGAFFLPLLGLAYAAECTNAGAQNWRMQVQRYCLGVGFLLAAWASVCSQLASNFSSRLIDATHLWMQAAPEPLPAFVAGPLLCLGVFWLTAIFVVNQRHVKTSTWQVLATYAGTSLLVSVFLAARWKPWAQSALSAVNSTGYQAQDLILLLIVMMMSWVCWRFVRQRAIEGIALWMLIANSLFFSLGLVMGGSADISAIQAAAMVAGSLIALDDFWSKRGGAMSLWQQGGCLILWLLLTPLGNMAGVEHARRVSEQVEVASVTGVLFGVIVVLLATITLLAVARFCLFLKSVQKSERAAKISDGAEAGISPLGQAPVVYYILLIPLIILGIFSGPLYNYCKQVLATL